jgi:hypothetical protein
MKKILSLALILCMLFSMSGNALAAEQKTNSERIQALKDSYGFTDIGYMDWRTAETVAINDTLMAKSLTSIETAFNLIGSATTKKIFNAYHTYPLEKSSYFKLTLFMLDIESYDSFYRTGILGEMSTPTDSGGGMTLHMTNSYIPEVKTIVHETMHAMDHAMLGVFKEVKTEYHHSRYIASNKGSDVVEKINGSYNGFTSANQYVNWRAAQNKREDFAYSVTEMIVGGGNNPCTVSKDSILYKKYVACYELLLDEFGVKSNSVKRAAAFLRKELPTE